jgi:multisubunit Na+/H+ antiporter MnhC subunit
MGEMNTLYIIVLVIAGLFLLPRALKVAAALGLLALTIPILLIAFIVGLVKGSRPKPMTPAEANRFFLREKVRRWLKGER